MQPGGVIRRFRLSMRVVIAVAALISVSMCKTSTESHQQKRRIPWPPPLKFDATEAMNAHPDGAYPERQNEYQESPYSMPKTEALVSNLEQSYEDMYMPLEKQAQNRKISAQTSADAYNEARIQAGKWECAKGDLTNHCASYEERPLKKPLRDISACPAGTLMCHCPATRPTLENKCLKPFSSDSSTTVTLGAGDYRAKPGGSLEVHTLPIGQGDCNIIYCPNKADVVIFDCGSTSKSDQPRLSPANITKFLSDSTIKRITILLSHGDQDHYNYLPQVFTDDSGLIDKIQGVFFGGNQNHYSCTSSNKNIKALFTKIGAKKVRPATVGDLNLCNDPKIHFNVIAVNKGTAKNEMSIVMKLYRDGQKSSLLFTGDMEYNAAEQLVADATTKALLQSTHYKVAHHGACTKANKDDWLAAIRPIEVHISSAFIGSYGHPRCRAIEGLMNLDSIGFIYSKTSHSVHDFACVGDTKTEVIEGKICHRIFSTSPTRDKMCLIKLTFGNNKNDVASTQYYCGTMKQWEADSVDVPTCPLTSDDDDDDVL